ncbi:MAG TPA: hypothetical protein DCL61_09505 [Cyanobacteria bacterium UBA12227]|nr:hypothetical protein [Cyanobacteria bacterium UBA12227]HAX85220.1 hypothetical protein [Cyanobacteria bacterium UBA11370]HBY76424.1 hypothetical protein [Cyanobacteria bacterium UBA11148]
MQNLPLKKGGYLPVEYFIDFLEFLKKNNDLFEIITYDDLPWGNDFDGMNNYPTEYKNWKRELAEGVRNKHKIYVLLQHDVDSFPDRTMAILQEEQRLGIRSNVMLFNRRIDRRHLKQTGEVRYTDYKIDSDFLRQLQDESGFVIGYHCNAYEQATFNLIQAQEIFEQDLTQLQQQYQIRYFSAHGGVAGPKGLNNKDIRLPSHLNYSLRWVHNGRSVRFDGNYSDGGFKNPHKQLNNRDLRKFVKTWRQGQRYRILTHPQYYHSPCNPSEKMIETEWLREVVDFYHQGYSGSVWDRIYPSSLKDLPSVFR